MEAWDKKFLKKLSSSKELSDEEIKDISKRLEDYFDTKNINFKNKVHRQIVCILFSVIINEETPEWVGGGDYITFNKSLKKLFKMTK